MYVLLITALPGPPGPPGAVGSTGASGAVGATGFTGRIIGQIVDVLYRGCFFSYSLLFVSMLKFIYLSAVHFLRGYAET